MSLPKSNPAQRAAGRARECHKLAAVDGSENKRPSLETQDRAAATIAKNAREEIRVALRTLYGRRMLDVRVFADNGQGERRPTPKGLAIRPELISELRSALDAAEALARREGLL